ncbi:MAG: hypothetical protein U0165_10020 [Polyangiaceae bacterium]
MFPAHPVLPSRIDPDFADEESAARKAGFSTGLLSHQAAVAHDRKRIEQSMRQGAGQAVLYRGWMMSELSWTASYEAMRSRGYAPLIEPSAYAEAHYLPLALPYIASMTAKTTFTTGFDFDEAWRAAKRAGCD